MVALRSQWQARVTIRHLLPGCGRNTDEIHLGKPTFPLVYRQKKINGKTGVAVK